MWQVFSPFLSYEGLEHNIEDSESYNAETSEAESGAQFTFSCSNATSVLKKEYKNFAISGFIFLEIK